VGTWDLERKGEKTGENHDKHLGIFESRAFQPETRTTRIQTAVISVLFLDTH